MKNSLILVLALTLSSTVFARQYIQCGSTSSTEVAVVNLNPKRSTLMLSPGMETGNYILVTLDENLVIKDETHFGQVLISKEDLGKNSDHLVVTVDMDNYKMTYSCFSRMYEE